MSALREFMDEIGANESRSARDKAIHNQFRTRLKLWARSADENPQNEIFAETGWSAGSRSSSFEDARTFAAPDLLNARHESARGYVEQKQHTTKADPQGTAGPGHRDQFQARRRAARSEIRRSLESLERRLLAPRQVRGRT